MKKLIAMLLVLAMVLTFAACGKEEAPAQAPAEAPVEAAPEAAAPAAPETQATEPATVPTEAEPVFVAPPVMTFEEYMAAPIDTVVTVETYVQASQSWWDNTVTLYCQSREGAYFLFCVNCSEEDAAKLVPGTKIQVSGYKAMRDRQVEILGGIFSFVEGGDTFIAEAADLTDMLGETAILIHQNEFAAFKGLTVEAIEYENGEPGDDITLTLSLDGASYTFLVESYLTGPDSEVYTTVGTLRTGRKVDVQGFLLWSGDQMMPHITAIALAQ